MDKTPETLDEWQEAINTLNGEKGWNDPNRSEAEWAALAHTEISEAFESWRDGEPLIFARNGKPEGAAIEYADVLYRTLHWFAAHGIRAQDAMTIKFAYNQTRPFRHGGKRA